MNKMTVVILLSVLAGFALCSCKEREQIKLSQYIVEGMTLYRNHCANCHATDGSGLAHVIPPLKNSDYLMNLQDKHLACQIKTGMSDSILVNGILYYQPMPANEKLTALEIAELVTYVKITWGDKKGIYGVKQAEVDLSNCN